MSNFDINQTVPPQNEKDAKQVVYHLNENPFGLPISARALTSLIIGVIFLAIIAAVATFIISTQQGKEPDPLEFPTPTLSEKVSPTLKPTTIPSPTANLPTPTIASASPSITQTPTISPSPTQNSFKSTKYNYSFAYPEGWSVKNFGYIDSKTPEMVGLSSTTPITQDAPILVAVKNRPYDEEKAIGTGIVSQTSVNGISGTKRVWSDSSGVTYTKVIIPFNSNSMIFVGKSPNDAQLNIILNSYSGPGTTLGSSTESPENAEHLEPAQ